MDIANVKRNNEGKRRKRKNEGLNKRKNTLVKKAYELGEFDGIDVALIICKHGRYTTYRSKDYASWPPSMAEIQTTYPLPKNILPQDIEGGRSEKQIASKEQGGCES
ncbi:hypothetical protein LARI1_G001644 [Lachnellula arida]|uniref:MADS-box domain-containing protein n=1 Tax=Lachnellula arida TaxID=1316785 RepID=A0A8T9BLI7_9HELO|nr:hypothetical protein LARI1_G001644 [Lachnellula arida]